MEYFFEQVYLKDQCWPTQWGVVLHPLYSNVLLIDKKRFKYATDLCRYHDCENGFGRLLSIYIFLRLFKANNKSNWGPNLLKLEQFSCFQSVWNDIEYYRKDPHSLRDVMSRVRNMLGSIPIISTNYYTVYISCFSSNREIWRSQNNGRAIPVVCCDLSLQPIMYVIVSD